VRLYRLTLDAPARNTQPRYNVCPTTPIDAVIGRDGKRELLSMRWGLVPSWWSKPLKEMKVATFNARVETVAEKPVFRDAFKRSRCVSAEKPLRDIRRAAKAVKCTCCRSRQDALADALVHAGHDLPHEPFH
jgi:SOS response associated peptidase (SRAP)